ncbi:ribonuclease toxin immunity protein CdiI [Pseudomonas cannabina]|uniref:CDI immunity protein domain-containing protein n=1 Tax=Pseudomonas cannabina TaxID=86840 RepID=A0A0P9LV09_PSECA|nr:ribonuclease toxin immunity protein CdiI [Pseudomonas cannabina]KAA8707086.1 ribonuclease toxin immunity protein CdiI [Pseudomonas cannabina]KPW74284.1 Uncharacterized protein ALO81_03481 [Pseudomonas cannabina]SDR40557.1 hypothetical protein SAMN05216597_4364 [Pseudomonas cannabina]
MSIDFSSENLKSEYLFETIDPEKDKFSIVKEFFNSIYMSQKFLYGLSLMAEGVGFCFDETYFHFPDLESSSDELRFEGLMFGVFDGEVIVSEVDGYNLTRLACEKYLQHHPEDMSKINDLLAKLPI